MCNFEDQDTNFNGKAAEPLCVLPLSQTVETANGFDFSIDDITSYAEVSLSFVKKIRSLGSNKNT
jgi:hypothetical protein